MIARSCHWYLRTSWAAGTQFGPALPRQLSDPDSFRIQQKTRLTYRKCAGQVCQLMMVNRSSIQLQTLQRGNRPASLFNSAGDAAEFDRGDQMLTMSDFGAH